MKSSLVLQESKVGRSFSLRIKSFIEKMGERETAK
jgi:hypothetical protein